MYRIGIDLGGTNTVAGLVDQNEKIIDRESVKTNLPTNLDRIVADMGKLCHILLHRNHLKKEDVVSVGVGVPCTADETSGWMLDADHLGFPGGPLVQRLQQALQMPVAIGNDANCAAWGEFKAYEHPGDSMILVTLGTGVGGGIIVHGKLHCGINHAAGELGHMMLYSNGAPCTCGRRGCFEAHGSATALIGQGKTAMQQQKQSLLWQLCLGDPARLEARTIFEAASQADPVAVQLVEDYTTCLADGFANLINIFGPACLCIGGGVSGAGDALLQPVREKTMQRIYAKTAKQQPQIVLAKLGNDAGILGAALLEKREEIPYESTL